MSLVIPPPDKMAELRAALNTIATFAQDSGNFVMKFDGVKSGWHVFAIHDDRIAANVAELIEILCRKGGAR